MNIYVSKPTLRDYYAARAPKKIPKWFGYQSPPPKPPLLLLMLNAQLGFAELPEDQKQRLRDWMRDSWDTLEPELMMIASAAQTAFVAARDEYEKARREREEMRYYSWRWAYADSMLAKRGGVA